MPSGLTRFQHTGQGHFALSAATIGPFDSFAALSRSGQALVVYHGRKPTNLRVGIGAGAAQFQASRLRVRSHAGACSPAA
jgi:hypothetical protein